MVKQRVRFPLRNERCSLKYCKNINLWVANCKPICKRLKDKNTPCKRNGPVRYWQGVLKIKTMNELKILNELREGLKTKETQLSATAFLFNDPEAKLSLMKSTKKRKNIEKQIFAIISNS